ncbi:hypothetical protein K502DRAFT_362539 [Neoconidiobolus thromboides FSU 785]|nr:hypothetical protein K502DRAFT_362539 [Neoconidiobolus thromboides FSU 785]
MQLEFDKLSDILLKKAFKPVNPEESIDLCFLNKELFNIANKELVEENRLFIKHMDTESKDLEYLNYYTKSNLNLDLEITRNATNYDFCFNEFEDLKDLKSIGLMGCISFYSDTKDDYYDFKFIKNNNVVALDCFDSDKILNYNFSKLSTLKEAYFKFLSRDLLNPISLFQNIQTIYIFSLYLYCKLHDSPSFSINDFHNGYSSIKCKFVKQVQANYCHTATRGFLSTKFRITDVKCFIKKSKCRT